MIETKIKNWLALSIAASSICLQAACGRNLSGLKTLETLPKTKIKLHSIDGSSPMALSPDGHILATGSKKAIKLWDPYTEKLIKTLPYAATFGRLMAFSPDGKWLACTIYKEPSPKDSTEVVQIWDVKSGEPVRTMCEHPKHIGGLSFSSDGKLLATGSADEAVKIWDVATSKLLRTIELKSMIGMHSMQFIPGGHDIFCTCVDYKTRILNADTGEVVRFLDEFQNPGAVAVSADGKLLVSDTHSVHPDLVKALHGEETLENMERSINGKLVVTTTATGKVLRSTPEPTEDGFISFAFSPDGKTIAAGNGDYTLGFWDAESTKELIRIVDDGITQVQFTPDGSILAIELDDGEGIQLLPLTEVEVLKGRIPVHR